MPKNIVILTGAGISAESGLDTFRDQGGLWANHSVDEVATPEAFVKNPKKVQKFYNQRRQELRSVEPNNAHRALATLEERWDGDFTLITQNVDDLHERAGSKNLLHMHGELLKVRCTHSHEIISWQEDLDAKTPSPFHPEGILRPHIVWFGELPLYMDVIFRKLDEADIFVAIGTSGQVYPAGGFVQHVYMKGNCDRIEINLDQSDLSYLFNEHYTGKATEEVPKWVDALLQAK